MEIWSQAVPNFGEAPKHPPGRRGNQLMESTIYADARWAQVAKDSSIFRVNPGHLAALELNPSRNLPYHGNQHLLTVAILAVRGALANQLEEEEIRAVLIAGLYHDYGYSPELTEPENIAAAVAYAADQLEQLGDRVLIGRVSELIRETAMPHSTPSSLAAAVLQDADLLMVTQPDFEQFLRGLIEEHPELIPDPSFPGESALSTAWAKRVYATAWAMQLNGERVLDPFQAASVGNTLHLQRMSSKGFLVDSSIADQLEQLWDAGYTTLYSCGGDGELISPGYGAPVPGYIAFTGATDKQLEVLERAAIAAERPLEHYYPEDGPRKVIRFDAKNADAVFAVLLRG